MNLPFHLSAGGSQSSMLISESDEGLRTSWTRQRAGMMARTTDAVRALTGCPPRSFSHFAHDHAAQFGAGALAA